MDEARRAPPPSQAAGVRGCSAREAVTPGGTIPELNTRSAIPRYQEIDDDLARKICRI